MDRSMGNPWDDMTAAMLGGIAVFGTMVFLVGALQTPGIAPPTDVVPWFIFDTTAAIIGIMLCRRRNRIGYLVAIVTGVFIFVTIGVAISATGAQASGGSISLGPLLFALLGLAVIVTAVIALRRTRSDRSATPPSSPS